jgi:hypothetical protein
MLIALDFLLNSLPMKSPWGDLKFFSEPAVRIKGLDFIPKDSRIFHSELITDRVADWKLKTGQDWDLLKELMVPSIGVSYGALEAASYSVLSGKRNIRYIRRLNSSPVSSVLFDYAGISKIISISQEGMKKSIPDRDDCGVIENPNFFPRAFMVQKGPARIIKYKPGDTTIEAQGPGQLVFSETYYPGWNVIVDGKKNDPIIFEDTFVGVKLLTGDHIIRFIYKPTTFIIGLILSLFTSLIVFLKLYFMSLRGISYASQGKGLLKIKLTPY